MDKIFKCLGASNHCADERQEHDYYATDPRCVEDLLRVEKFNHYIWECAAGGGHISQVLKDNGYEVRSSDLVDRGYEGTEILDFLTVSKEDVRSEVCRDFITNPPYGKAQQFLEKMLELSEDGTKIALFLKLTFLEGQKRKELFKEYPPKTVYVYSKRVKCGKNGDFESIGSSAVAYAWYVWEKGWKGDPVVKWINLLTEPTSLM